MEKNAKKWTLGSAIKIAIPIGAVNFGMVCGPAMASGAYATQYFVRWGVKGIWMLLLYMLMIGIGLYAGFMLVASHKAYNYKDYYYAIYGKKIGRYALPVLDIYSLMMALLGGASCFAMGGTIFNTLFGWNTWIGTIIFAILGVVLIVYGAPLLRKASTAMTVTLLVGFFILIFFVLKLRGAELGNLMSSPNAYQAWGVGAISAGWLTIAQYGWSGMNGAYSLSNVCQGLRNGKDALVASIVTPIMSGFLFFLTIIITLPYCPEALTSSMPILDICVQYIKPIAPWVTALYYIVVFFAVASTIPTLLFTISNRWKNTLFKGDKLTDTKKNIITSAIVAVLCIAVSRLGLLLIISKGYTALGTVAFPLIVIPLLIVAFPKSRKKFKEMEVQE